MMSYLMRPQQRTSRSWVCPSGSRQSRFGVIAFADSLLDIANLAGQWNPDSRQWEMCY